MYGKIFESMYKGTLYGQWEAIITFQQLIVLADEDGLVDMTPPAIAATTSIPLEHIEHGIDVLSQVDKYSRSGAEEGRRIVLVDEERPWGWRIVNYAFYRNLANREDKKKKDRDRIADKRNAKKSNKINSVAECRNESQIVSNVAHTDTNTNTTKSTFNSDEVEPYLDFNQWWFLYPRKEDKKKAVTAWNRLTKKNKKTSFAHLEGRPYSETEKKFIPLPTTYINGERWNDAKSADQVKADSDKWWEKGAI